MNVLQLTATVPGKDAATECASWLAGLRSSGL